jgi:hypothetical protein
MLTDSITGPIGDLISKFDGNNKMVSMLAKCPSSCWAACGTGCKDAVQTALTSRTAALNPAAGNPTTNAGTAQNQACPSLRTGTAGTLPADRTAIDYIVSQRVRLEPDGAEPHLHRVGFVAA